MNQIKGMTTCTVCGRDLSLLAEEHYIAREPGRSGIAAIAGGPEFGLWDVIDCPHCGCQIKLQPRMRITDCFGRDYPCYCGDDDDDDPVCPFPKGGECYCKDSCGPDCEFHPGHNPHPGREEKD